MGAIVALRDPSTKRRHAYVSRTLVFGSAAAVLRYNVLSRLLAALTNRRIGILLVCYFGDFSDLVRRVLGGKSLEVSSRFFPLLGFQLKPGKSMVGPSLCFLGLLGDFPSTGNNFRISISLTHEKRRRWPRFIVNFRREGKIPHSCLDKLIGKMSFPQTSLFWGIR